MAEVPERFRGRGPVPDDGDRDRVNPRFSVSRVDIDRGGPTYTKDTLQDLHALNPDAELFFITGADALSSILSWQGWEVLFDLARFIGVSRPGYDLRREHITDALGSWPRMR